MKSPWGTARVERRGAKRNGSAREIHVKALQRRADRDHHEGRRECGVGQDQAKIAAGEPDRREEEIKTHRGDDAGHDHRRQYEGQHRRLEPALPLREAQRSQRAEYHGQHGRRDADDHAVFQRRHPARRIDEGEVQELIGGVLVRAAFQDDPAVEGVERPVPYMPKFFFSCG